MARLLRRGFALALARRPAGDAQRGAGARGRRCGWRSGEGWLDAEVTARDAGDGPGAGRGRPAPRAARVDRSRDGGAKDMGAEA